MKSLSGNSFGEFIKADECLIQFSAIWCGPCKALTQTLQSSGITTPMGKVDIDVDVEVDIRVLVHVMSPEWQAAGERREEAEGEEQGGCHRDEPAALHFRCRRRAFGSSQSVLVLSSWPKFLACTAIEAPPEHPLQGSASTCRHPRRSGTSKRIQLHLQLPRNFLLC